MGRSSTGVREMVGQSRDPSATRRMGGAAYACGVLSHYFTDPTMPLHTGQTERESIVHRPMEWSICKSYEEIYRMSLSEATQIELQPLGGTAWISHQVLASAKIAHSYYDRLIQIYDVETGCIDPPRGLNDEARRILAKLFAIAIHGWRKWFHESVRSSPRKFLSRR